jgi:predicted small secreted protein
MKRFIIGLTLALIATVLTVGIALAAYSATITVTNSGGTSYAMTGANVTANIDYLADNGMIEADGLDTRVLRSTTEIPHLLVTDRLMFATPINASSSLTLSFTTGNSDLDSMYIIVGNGGFITVSDNETLELGGAFQILIANCYLNTTAGAGKYIIYKDSALEFSVSSTTTGTITFSINGGASVTATAIPSGEYDIEITSDGTDLFLYLDETLKDTDTMTANVTDNGNDWIMCSGNTTIYVGSLKVIK